MTQSGQAFNQSTWRLALPRSLKQPPAYLSALDDEDQATAKLCVQKAAQAADEAWQQTIGGLQGPGVANQTIASLEHPGNASQDEDSDDMDFSTQERADSVRRSSKRSFHDSPLKGCLAAGNQD